jgi:hypothetical protein
MQRLHRTDGEFVVRHREGDQVPDQEQAVAHIREKHPRQVEATERPGGQCPDQRFGRHEGFCLIQPRHGQLLHQRPVLGELPEIHEVIAKVQA